MRKWLMIIIAGAFLAALALPALAVFPVEQNQKYEIKLPEFDPYGDAGGPGASQQVERTLAQRYGGLWHVQAWNSQTHTPQWIYGGEKQFTQAVRDERDLEQLSRQVIAANSDVLGSDDASLRLLSTKHPSGTWVANFQQTYNGLDVLGGWVSTNFNDGGKLTLMGSNFYRGIELNTTPSLTGQTAINLAESDLPFNVATDRVVDQPTLLILPVPVTASAVEHHLVWRLSIRTENPFGEWQTDVDAHNGEILSRRNQIYFDYLGTTTSPVDVNTYCDGVHPLPNPYQNVVVSGVGTAVTDVNGAWRITGTGGDRAVTVPFIGTYVNVANYNGAEGQFTGTAHLNQSLPVVFTDLNSRADERDTFEAIGRVHEFFLTFAPTFSYVNQSINAYVNRSDGYCPGNAWWDGTINFCAAGGQYHNTGEMQQVVEHEFGHGVQDALLGGQGGTGMGEGNSDILGNLITQDPIIGRGFFVGNCTSGIRNSLNTLRYPGDVIGQEDHTAGQVIAGFNWDAMVLFQAQYGTALGTQMSADRWHRARRDYIAPIEDQPAQVLATFMADDDNANLDDGTPNYDILCQAATNHGFSCPPILVGVFVYHDPIPYQSKASGSYNVVCTAASMGGGTIVPSSVTLHYSVNGGPMNTAPMPPEGDHFHGLMPAQAFGSVVQYYISASNTLGAEGFSPSNAPTDLHYLQVNTQFADAIEVETAWTVGATGDDASAGLWEQGNPEGTTFNGHVVQTENDHTADPGALCFVTGAAAGSAAGSNDVDGGKTSLMSPKFDLTGGSDLSVSYWRWYTNQWGNSPGVDYWTVQLSNDGGATWTNVEHTQNSNEAWQQVVINFSDYFAVPGVAQVKFIAEDIAPGSLVEAAVDDFMLVGTFDLTGVDDESGLNLSYDLSQNHPNPFNPRTTVSFALQQSGPANLRVFDAQGRVVKVLVNQTMDAGQHQAVWNGDDASGRPVSAGVYFYRLDAGGRTFSKRMLLVK